jgi:hypothetical protein
MEYDPGPIGKNYFAASRRCGRNRKLSKSPFIVTRLLLIFKFPVPVMEDVIGDVLLPAPFPLCKIALLPTVDTRKHLIPK